MSIKLSQRTAEVIGRLQRALRLRERPPLIRLAFAIGLAECSGILPTNHDSKGPEIPLKVITAGQDTLMDALIAEVFETPLDQPADRRRIYKCLVDYGFNCMAEDFKKAKGGSEYLVALARRSFSAGPNSKDTGE